ncbi:hypothetical protein [Thermocrinis sp.]
MKKFISFGFVVLGFFLFGAGIYTSFEIYATKKQEKVMANIASLVLSVVKGEELKTLDHPDQGFFILTSPEGKKYIFGEVLQNPIDPNMYSHYSKKDPSGGEVVVYIKGYNFGELVEELIKNPSSLGISLSGIILFLTGVFYILSQKPKEKEAIGEGAETREESYTNLENKLKALRLALATHKIIPKESSEEAKNILDDILKEMEGRR